MLLERSCSCLGWSYKNDENGSGVVEGHGMLCCHLGITTCDRGIDIFQSDDSQKDHGSHTDHHKLPQLHHLASTTFGLCVIMCVHKIRKCDVRIFSNLLCQRSDVRSEIRDWGESHG